MEIQWERIDWGLVVDIVQTFLIVFSLYFVKIQIKQSTTIAENSSARARDESMLTYFASSIDRFYPQIVLMEKTFGLEALKKPATAEIIKKIESDPILEKEIGYYLTFLETMSSGVNDDIYDFDMANRILGGGIVSAWIFLEPYILKMRKDRHYPGLFDQIEILGKRFLDPNRKRTLNNI